MNRRIERVSRDLIDIRKELHRFPEVGFRERRTASLVAEYLKKAGIDVETEVGGTGVTGLLRGGRDGPTIALRACLDALAMDERSGVEYSSRNEGVFHGCGHDGNMTMVMGAAKVLSRYRTELSGNVKFIFQPSEEETGGAAAVIEAGCLKNPDVEAIITLHNWHGLRQGVIVVKPGPVLASSDLFQLEIIGKAGHGAWPHLALDPIVVAAEVVSALQKIVSRELDPLKAAVISIGRIQGGTAANIIPEKVILDGTVRTFDPAVRDFIQVRVEEIARGVTEAARSSYRLRYERIMPPVINDQQLTARVRGILSASLESGMMITDFAPAMGCEEFSLFQQEIPGLFLFIGNDREGEETIPLHAPNYVFNDNILETGVKALCAIVSGYRPGQ